MSLRRENFSWATHENVVTKHFLLFSIVMLFSSKWLLDSFPSGLKMPTDVIRRSFTSCALNVPVDGSPISQTNYCYFFCCYYLAANGCLASGVLVFGFPLFFWRLRPYFFSLSDV